MNHRTGDGEGLFEGVDRLAQQLLSGSGAEYEAGMDLMGHAMTYVETEPAAVSLYLIWGHLTDQIDGPGYTPEREASTIAAMRRAASQWLATKVSPSGIDEYLDHWRYDECGYERRT
jgi:hypothetical protein